MSTCHFFFSEGFCFAQKLWHTLRQTRMTWLGFLLFLLPPVATEIQ